MPDNYSRQAATNNRLLKRSCESLIGLCAGLMADGVLNDEEIKFLNLWLIENQEISQTWPAEVIYKRVSEVLADGKITEDERQYLEKTLTDLIGGTLQETGATSGLPTNLPVENVDNIEIKDNYFCFTGTFLYGTRSACERAIIDRKGLILPRVTLDLDYLVIGSITTHDWAHTSYGRKIEKAMEYKKRGSNILIVNEEQWIQYL